MLLTANNQNFDVEKTNIFDKHVQQVWNIGNRQYAAILFWKHTVFTIQIMNLHFTGSLFNASTALLTLYNLISLLGTETNSLVQGQFLTKFTLVSFYQYIHQNDLNHIINKSKTTNIIRKKQDSISIRYLESHDSPASPNYT